MSVDRKIHSIWIGPNPLPAREKQWSDRMAIINPTWRYHLHGNELLARYATDPYISAMQTRKAPLAFVADRLRILLLRDEGGVYLDADCQPIRPLDSISIWDKPELDFVMGFRSPHRKDVALHRGIALVDNHFMGSAKGGRMVNRVASLWAPDHIVINGHDTGICAIENADWTTMFLGQKFFCAMQEFPETVVLHDCHNIGSWTTPKIPVTSSSNGLA